MNCDWAVPVFDYLRNRFPSEKIDFKRPGVAGGTIDHGGVSMKFSPGTPGVATYEEAYWIMRGIASAAKEEHCVFQAKIDVFKDGREDIVTRVLMLKDRGLGGDSDDATVAVE